MHEAVPLLKCLKALLKARMSQVPLVENYCTQSTCNTELAQVNTQDANTYPSPGPPRIP